MAAMYVAARRGRQRGKEEAAVTVVEFPPPEECILDTELYRQVLSSIGDTWQKRRVCLSKDRLLLGKVGANDVIDYVPLDEIVTVAAKNEAAESADKSAQQGEKRSSIKRTTTLKIDDVSMKRALGK
eukprot:299462-Hanusia_phi.AAC.1